MIIAPPPAVAYPFLLDLKQYPAQIINFLVVSVSRILSIITHSISNHIIIAIGLDLFALETTGLGETVQRFVVYNSNIRLQDH